MEEKSAEKMLQLSDLQILQENTEYLIYSMFQKYIKAQKSKYLIGKVICIVNLKPQN